MRNETFTRNSGRYGFTRMRCSHCLYWWTLELDKISPCGGIIMGRGTTGRWGPGAPVVYLVPSSCTRKLRHARRKRAA